MSEFTECCCISNEEAHEILKEMEYEAKIDKWVSAKDKLPDEDTWVLVYAKQGSYMNLKVDFIHGGEWFNSLLVTHWMHLPEPPESEVDAE